MKKLIFISILFLLFSDVFAETKRTKAILTGDEHTRHHWECKNANTHASCSAGYSSYYSAGDYIGVAYKWGGFDTVEQFDQNLADGYGAGSYSSDGVLWCVTGVDCSGYVSLVWDQTTKYGTSTIHEISSVIDISKIKRGDAFNKASSHIVMYVYTAHDGSPVIMEAAGGSFRKAVFRKVTWSYLNDYIPIRYDNIVDDFPAGTKDNPIIIDNFPFNDENNTRTAISKEFHSCSAAPERMELGPEIIYKFQTDIQGDISISVTDVQSEGIDCDAHLLSSLTLNEDGMSVNCKARADKEIEEHIEAGIWYIIVDSFTGSSGVDFPGEYTLSVDFTPDEIEETPDEDETPDSDNNETNDDYGIENDSDIYEETDYDDEYIEFPDTNASGKDENDTGIDEYNDFSEQKSSGDSKGCSVIFLF